MIVPLLIASAVSAARPAAAPVVPGGPSAHEILIGAQHAIREQRLDQARVMVARAISAGASGTELARVLADFAFASGKYDEAATRYQSLASRFPSNELFLERGGLSALKIGELDRASAFLLRATALHSATWRAWNALGVLADMNGDWAKSDECYDEATRLAPNEVEPVNNRGWSLLMRGKWQDARGYFERASEMDPSSVRIANNLDLANTALAASLPQRQPGETDLSWAARLNDAGVAAAMLGDKQRAVAAFTQAIDARGTWYERAANNLDAINGK